eukprot:g2609.t1
MLTRYWLRLKKILFSKNSIRAVVIGAPNAGKSCIVRGFCEETFLMREVDPTYGYEIKTTHFGGKNKRGKRDIATEEEEDEDEEDSIDNLDLGLDMFEGDSTESKEGNKPTAGQSIDPEIARGGKKTREKDTRYQVVFWDFGSRKDQDRSWPSFLPGTDVVIWVVDCSREKSVRVSIPLLDKVLQEKELLPPYVPFLVLANKVDSKFALSPEKVEELMALEDRLHDHPYHVFPCSAFAPPPVPVRGSRAHRARFASFAGLDHLSQRLEKSFLTKNAGIQQRRSTKATPIAAALDPADRLPPLVSGKAEIVARPWGLEPALRWLVTIVREQRCDEDLQLKIRAITQELRDIRKNRKKTRSKAKVRSNKIANLEAQLKFGAQRFGRALSKRFEESTSTPIATKERGRTVKKAVVAEEEATYEMNGTSEKNSEG